MGMDEEPRPDKKSRVSIRAPWTVALGGLSAGVATLSPWLTTSPTSPTHAVDWARMAMGIVCLAVACMGAVLWFLQRRHPDS